MKSVAEAIGRFGETRDGGAGRLRIDRRVDPDRGKQPGAYYPGAPVWEPWEGLDAFFPDASTDLDTSDDED
jgi:hypothetical protein